MADIKIYIVPNVRSITSGMKETKSEFLCPSNTVMTGRYHKGNEKGQTQYEYATLKVVDANGKVCTEKVSVEEVTWSSAFKESSGMEYDAPSGHVIVGRKHTGDENGYTQYATAIIKVNGKAVELTSGKTSSYIKESAGVWYKTDANYIMTGRHHSGDENGKTYYTSAIAMYTIPCTDQVPKGTILIPKERKLSGTMKEKGNSFICPSGTVMTGRLHTGDENGTTQYEYATLKAINAEGEEIEGSITIEEVEWGKEIVESAGVWFNAENNRVIVGRKHMGDEKGTTQYATAIIKFNGRQAYIKDIICSKAIKESSNVFYKTDSQRVIVGRTHYGDENGNSFYNAGIITTELKDEKEEIKVIVALHPEEKYYPMNPMDFIKLSRLRKHVQGGIDYGYNKNTKSFVKGDYHEKEYYDIPIDIVNSFHLTDHDSLYNLRPRDTNSIGKDEVFLQPDGSPIGNPMPTGIVQVFTYSTFYKMSSGAQGELREFWVFYGYDYAKKLLDLSHQGDWEKITLKIESNEIVGAWLSQHSRMPYYEKEKLKIYETSSGAKVLKVYSAQGSHAFYANTGSFKIPNAFGAKDDAQDGYQWEITRNSEKLLSQPWALFAGGWGEVGEDVPKFKGATTGPLGPLYKVGDYGTQDDSHISISSLISQNQFIIVPNVRKDTEGQQESISSFETEDNMLLTGMKHSENENGSTIYQYASLRAINYSGSEVDGKITIIDRQWSEWHKESDSASFFVAPEGRVLTGREHKGDENGETRYQTGIVCFNGKQASVCSASSILPYKNVKESGGIYFRSASKFILIGRTHSGDENGVTSYYQGYIVIENE